MRIFSFRSKRLLRRVLLTVLAVLLAAALLLLCRFLYLSRYVVYSGNEAYLDFDRTLSATRDPQQTQNPDDFPFTTLIASQSPDEPQTQQRSKIQGYYITTNMLSDGVDAVRAALDAANDYDAVMIDVKSVFGNYYYRSKLSGAQIATSADIDAVEALIRELTARTDLTVIARRPGFLRAELCLRPSESGARPLFRRALDGRKALLLARPVRRLGAELPCLHRTGASGSRLRRGTL